MPHKNKNGTCHNDADCQNTIGSFECMCKDGFDGNGFECNDLNECTLGKRFELD